MACQINLNERLVAEGTAGYFVFLGYSATSQVAASTNIANDVGDNCFGITDPFNNASYTEYDSSINALPSITANTAVNYNVSGTLISIPDNHPVGFYGFMYVNGDTDVDGAINGTECGDVECFEIEVVEGPSDMSADDLDDLCVANLPETVDLVAQVTDYLAGGTWSSSYTGLNLTDPTAVILPGTIPANTTIVFTYEITADDLTSTHPFTNGETLTECPDCEATVTVSVTINEAAQAGTGSSIAVCN